MTPASDVPRDVDVLVVGAGLTGLSCARALTRAGRSVHVLEASDGIGGRIRTDDVRGFRLDRGFQVLLTGYEEVESQVDMEVLDLRPFEPGSLVWTGSSMARLADPFRAPSTALASLMAPVGTLADKMKIASLRRRLLSEPAETCFSTPDRTTLEELRALGFSEAFIDGFFRPFLGGVFLERELETSARLFRYYFRCFSSGDATLPAGGMQRLPESLATELEGRITIDAPVVSVSGRGVTIRSGVEISARTVVLAADGAAAARLLGARPPAFKATVTSYFATLQPPTPEPLLVLDGEGAGPVNHAAVLTHVAPEYAPEGYHLVSASGVEAAAEDPDGFAAAALPQMRRWFGSSVDRWEHLRTYSIPHALPRHPGGAFSLDPSPTVREDGLVVAGDYLSFGAIQGALLAGRRAAETVLQRR